MLRLDKQRNQLGRTISDDHIFRLCARIRCDAGAKSRVFPVRIGCDRIQIVCQRGTQLVRNSQWIDIRTEADDILLFDMIIFFDGFQVTAVKMIFVFNHNIPLSLQQSFA